MLFIHTVTHLFFFRTRTEVEDDLEQGKSRSKVVPVHAMKAYCGVNV